MSSPERPEFRDVFDNHVDYVWRCLGHLGVPRADIPDVAQEVFIVVHRRLPDWEPRHPIRTWLYTICRHQARDRAVRAHVRNESPTENPPETPVLGTPYEEVVASEALEQVRAALRTVDRDQQEVFLMYELEGLTMEEIATAVGCPVKTAYSRLRLARIHLQRALVRVGAEISHA